MPAKKPAKPKHKYQILVNRQHTYKFEVEAESAHKACQNLSRQLQAEDTVQEEAKGKPMCYRWNDPAEPGEEWAIMRTTPVEARNFLLLQAWNGRQFFAIGEADIGHDISHPMRKLVRLRARKEKPKKAKAES